MKAMKKKILMAAAIVFVVLMLGIAGRIDYTEQVIVNMSEQTYNEIKQAIGEDASEYEIARYYVENY